LWLKLHGWRGLKVGGHLAPFLYSSREPSELSQWLCYDDSIINIVVIIIIIIIVKCDPVLPGTQRYWIRRNSSYPQGSPKVAALTARLHRRRPAHARFMRKCTSTSQCRVNGTPQRLASRVSFRPNRADSNTITASGGQPTESIVLKHATSSTSGGGSGVRRPPIPSKTHRDSFHICQGY